MNNEIILKVGAVQVKRLFFKINIAFIVGALSQSSAFSAENSKPLAPNVLLHNSQKQVTIDGVSINGANIKGIEEAMKKAVQRIERGREKTFRDFKIASKEEWRKRDTVGSKEFNELVKFNGWSNEALALHVRSAVASFYLKSDGHDIKDKKRAVDVILEGYRASACHAHGQTVAVHSWFPREMRVYKETGKSGLLTYVERLGEHNGKSPGGSIHLNEAFVMRSLVDQATYRQKVFDCCVAWRETHPRLLASMTSGEGVDVGLYHPFLGQKTLDVLNEDLMREVTSGLDQELKKYIKIKYDPSLIEAACKS